MSDKRQDLVVVGVLLGAHGVRGDVRVKSFTSDPAALFDYAPFLFEGGEAAIEPVKVRSAKDHFIITPDRPRQKEDWDSLKGTKLYVPRTVLPVPEEEEYYIEDLVGLDVFSGGTEPIGKVKAMLNHGAGDLVEIQNKAGGKPILVPFTLEDVPVVDLAQRRIVVANINIWADDSPPDES